MGKAGFLLSESDTLRALTLYDDGYPSRPVQFQGQ